MVITKSGCGLAWLERLIWGQEVAGSNPPSRRFYKSPKTTHKS